MRREAAAHPLACLQKLSRDGPGFLRAYGDRHLVVRTGESEVKC